jgi:S1-C subfamily serine protease
MPQPTGHVITNYHVITDASEIQVTFQGGTEYSAKVVGFDQDKDIAVLQVCAYGFRS